ncbi:MAG TPA: hypothetical protein VF173_27115 [Thermoanaerobaculia bacterium]|nr:hypothetical protein [Thermoanaerobaculia bacterium]
MRKKSRLFALVGVLGLVALTGAAGAVGVKPPIETFCLCGCPDGTIICVGSVNGDCSVPCAQAMQLCPSDM